MINLILAHAALSEIAIRSLNYVRYALDATLRYATSDLNSLRSRDALVEHWRRLGRLELSLLRRRRLSDTAITLRPTLLRTRRYATLRYSIAACGAAARLQLGALGHSLSSSRPPGAVVVGACGAFSCAHLAARASSRARFLCRSEGGGMATAGCAGGRAVAAPETAACSVSVGRGSPTLSC